MSGTTIAIAAAATARSLRKYVIIDKSLTVASVLPFHSIPCALT